MPKIVIEIDSDAAGVVSNDLMNFIDDMQQAVAVDVTFPNRRVYSFSKDTFKIEVCADGSI